MGRKAVVALVVVAIVAAFLWFAFREEPAGQSKPQRPVDAPPAEEPATEKDRTRAKARHAETPANVETAAAAQPFAPKGPTLSGHVVDPEGKPVAGARIVSHPDDLGTPVASDKAGAEGSRSFTAKSGEDGRFTIRVDPKMVVTILTAEADAGFGQASADAKDRDVEIKLFKWTLLTGTVTNTAKQPVAGATVTAHLLLDALTEDHSAVTDANGQYRIERLPPVGWTPGAPFVGRGRHGWVIAEAAGYAPLLVDLDRMGGRGPPRTDATKLDLVFVRGITLSGKVIDGDTKAPLAGATVVCWSVEGMMGFGGPGGTSISNPWGPRPLGEAKSGDDGTFRFEHLPAQGPSGVASSNAGKRGQTLGHVAAWKEGYVYGGDEIPVSKDEASVESTIELWPSATITGRVVDQDGKPVADASAYVGVEARRPALNGFPSFYAESKTAAAKTDAEGRYTLTSFRASRNGPTTGKLSAEFARGGFYVSSNTVDVTATAGESVAAPDLVIDAGAIPRATIRVTDEAGAPISGATIERQMQPLRTGLDGLVQWSMGYAPQKPDAPIPAQSTVVRAKGFAPRQLDFTPTRGTPVEVTVVLKPGARIAGRVQNADGGPAGKATVIVADGAKTPEEVFGDGSPQFQMNARTAGRLVTYATVTARDDGTFEAPDLPDGPFLVAAQMPARAPAGFNRPAKMLRDVRPGVPAGTTDLVFVLPQDDSPPTQALDLIVTDASGGAVEGSYAQAVLDGGLRFYAQHVDPTKLRFPALPPGKGTIDVAAQGWAKTTLRDVEIAANAAPSPITVKLDRGVKLRGTVRAASGTLPDSVGISVSPLDQTGIGGAFGEVAKNGGFELTGFLPGRYRATVNEAGYNHPAVFVPTGDGFVDIPDGVREVVIDLTVQRAGTMSFLVRDKRLAPPPFSGGSADPEKEKFSAASRIEVVDTAGAVVSAVSSMYENYAPSASLAPGDYTVRLLLPGDPPQEQKCTVKAGESVSVRFPTK